MSREDFIKSLREPLQASGDRLFGWLLEHPEQLDKIGPAYEQAALDPDNTTLWRDLTYEWAEAVDVTDLEWREGWRDVVPYISGGVQMTIHLIPEGTS